MKHLQIGVVGHLPFTPRAHGLISEHWENVSKCPVPVPQQGSPKNGSHGDGVDRHPTLIAQASLRDLPDNEIAENQKRCRHEKSADDNNSLALFRKLLLAQL